MRFSASLFAAFVMIIASGCDNLSVNRLFDFEVEIVQDIKEEESYYVSPEKLYDNINLDSFRLCDTLLISYIHSKENFISVYNIKNGIKLAELCKRGRGPEEFLTMSPSFNQVDGCLSLYDVMKKRYSELDLWNSLVIGKEFYTHSTQVDSGSDNLLVLTYVYPLKYNHVLAYDARNNPYDRGVLLANSRFIMFNSLSGEIEQEFNCFINAPLKKNANLLFSSSGIFMNFGCLDPQKQYLFFAMARMPQVNILNIESGEVRGFRLSGKHKQSFKEPYFYFKSVCTSGEFIYALYYGGDQREMMSSKSLLEENEHKSSIYVFDWDGNLCNKYILDDVYSQCQYHNGSIYLSKITDDEESLYRVEI